MNTVSFTPGTRLIRVWLRTGLLALGLLLITGCSSRTALPLYDQEQVVRLAATSERPEVIIIPERNSLYANQARVKLVVAAGALQEEDDQIGLAHFVEHMAFRGTRAFPEQQLQLRMRELGIELGRHSNAYTTFDHTAYWLDLNDLSRGQLASSLEILAQWAYDIEFAPQAVNEEIAVIVEEWRLYQQDQERVQSQIQQALFKGSRQLERLSILGERADIEATTPEKLRHFYQQWYHPENMLLVVTGDVEAEQALALVEQYFTRPDLESERLLPQQYDLQPEAIPEFLIASDPYTPVGLLDINWLFAAAEYNARTELEQLSLMLVLDILQDRLAVKQLTSGGVVLGANSVQDRISANLDILGLSLVMTEPDFALAYEHLAHELARLLALGVTEHEWQAQLERMRSYLQSNQDSPAELASYALDFWLYQDPILNLSSHRARILDLLTKVQPKAGLETLARITSGPSFTLALYPDGSSAPTKQQLFNWREQALALPFAPLVEGRQPEWQALPPAVELPLAQQRPEGILEWQLANGVKVHYRHSDGMADRVFMRLTANNGFNQLDERQVLVARLLSDVLRDGGQAGLNSAELAQWRQALDIHQNFYIDFYDRSFYLEAPVASLDQALLDLHHKINFSPLDEELWQFNRQQELQYLQQLQQHPHLPWIEASNQALWQNDTAFRMMTAEEIESVSFAEAQELYQQFVQGNQSYRLAIVGDLSVEQAQDLVERYFANLPDAVPQGPGRASPQPIAANQVRVSGSGEEYASVILSYYLSKEALNQSYQQTPTALLAAWLDEQLFDRIRTQEGLVYSISSGIDGNLPVDQQFSLDIYLQTDPDRVDQAIAEVNQLLKQASSQPPSAQQVEVWQQTRADERQQARQNPAWLLNRMGYHQVVQQDPWQRIAPLDEAPEPQALSQLLAQILEQGQLLELVWLP